jgi:Na+-driven multidrug efflux pump
LNSAAVISNIRLWEPDHYIATIAAYGIVTRILTFAYLPLMGVNIAFQTICGNNYGARLMARTNGSLKIAVGVAIVYCGLVQVICLLFSSHFGAGFSDDPNVISETARVLPWTTLVYVLCGLPVVLSGYFQSIGDAPKAGIFGLSRTYMMTIPMVFVLPHIFGETGIWMAAPAADIGMIGLIAIVLAVNASRRGWRFGVLQPV